MNNTPLTFNNLLSSIRQIHENLTAQAGRAVNIHLTMRNWLIGCFIAEYELRGADRAQYGEKLLTELANRLVKSRISNCNRRQLYRYLRFYRLYPAIVGTLSPQLINMLPDSPQKKILKVGTAPTQLQTSPETLINRLSYSHQAKLNQSRICKKRLKKMY